jgi:hypothetical protein
MPLEAPPVPVSWTLLLASIFLWIGIFGLSNTIMDKLNATLTQRLIFYLFLVVLSLVILKWYEEHLHLVL